MFKLHYKYFSKGNKTCSKSTKETLNSMAYVKLKRTIVIPISSIYIFFQGLFLTPPGPSIVMLILFKFHNKGIPKPRQGKRIGMPRHLLLVLYAPISSFRQRLRLWIRIRTPIRVRKSAAVWRGRMTFFCGIL